MVQSLSLSMKYTTEVRGFGEVYEEVSIEYLRKRLKRKYKTGRLLLVPASGHPEAILAWAQGPNILEMGSVDCPPWESKPKGDGRRPNKALELLARFIFMFLVDFERYHKPHMLWILVGERKT